MTILAYTFRTNPFKEKLDKNFQDLFIFKKLKKDLEIFKSRILKEKPEIIIGIAKSKRTQFEEISINNFNNKKIDKLGKEKYTLSIIKSNFRVSEIPTNSFCNWTAYKISKFIQDNNLISKFYFIHLKEDDLEEFLDLIKVPTNKNQRRINPANLRVKRLPLCSINLSSR